MKREDSVYIIIYDFGTSSVKTCLFDIDSKINLVESESAGYGLYVSEDGGAEQDTEEWWAALQHTTQGVLKKSGIRPEDIEAVAFCSQMQGSIFVDKEGNALRRPMNCMDQRAVKEFKEGIGSGLIKVDGLNLFKIARNLRVNYAGPGSPKDPVWKYQWVKHNEPEIYKKIYKWLDVNDYLITRLTGRFVRTADTAFATLLYDTRKGKEGWNKGLLKMYKVDPKHMPEIVDSTDIVGKVTQKAATELGLAAGTPVFAGGGDLSFVNIGAGSTNVGDTHIYVGTSGWVSTFLDYQTVDLNNRITGVLSAVPGYFNYFSELETAGKCYEWAVKHLAVDEMGIYSNKNSIIEDFENKSISLYDYISEEIKKSPAGANGVIFTPWLQGNRCPFDDTNAAGMFFNIKIKNNEIDMIRAVLEGICYHLRWLLECEMKKVKTSDSIRFVGGGALSEQTCQMLADITGRTIETVANTQDVGAIGTALVVAAGVKGEDVLELAKRLVKVERVYVPNPEHKAVYERNYQVFKKLYKSNAANFKAINA